MQCGELGWWRPPAATVRPHLAVVGSPARNFDASLRQALEPVLVADLAVEARDVGERAS